MSRDYYELTVLTRNEDVPFGLSARFTYSSFELASKSASVFRKQFGVSPTINKITVDISEISEKSVPLES